MELNFPSGFPELQTSRLILRELNIDDAETLLQIRTCEEVNKHIGRSSEQTAATVQQFIDDRKQDLAAGKGIYWGITLKDSGVLIGSICYWNLDCQTPATETGYELLPAYQGKGIMNEAANAVFNYGFTEMHLKEIIACVAPANEASLKLLQRYNFVFTDSQEGLLIYKLSKDT